ncbi:hypothetical protein ACFPVY_02710 [Flavobacterium qiangtangense]|uniref:Uncharacterized protein n=1 Tax=Flavobacterium qiangtangense TaxID=1442595 RepID=A0ABW1PJ07_9FLAO
MESLEKLNEQLKKHLESISPFLITDFQSLINGENICLFDGIQQSDVAAFNFEYRHDYLDTTFFGTDKEGIKVTGDVGLLICERSAKFLPQTIWDRVKDIEDDEGIEDIEEALEEYNDDNMKFLMIGSAIAGKLQPKELRIRLRLTFRFQNWISVLN